jgi:hypothetical protein
MFDKGAWLGQAALIFGPSSWGAGMLNNQIPLVVPPFFAEWQAITPDGDVIDSGRVGPFSTVDAAVQAARADAAKAGVLQIGTDGFITVMDSRGSRVGPTGA